MARVCQVHGPRSRWSATTYRTPTTGPRRRFLPNLQDRRFWVESEKRWVRLRLTNARPAHDREAGIDALLAEMRGRGEI